MPISGGSSGAQLANGTYTLTNPLVGTNGTATTAPRSDMRPTIPTPATPTTQAFSDAATSGAGTGFATDTHKHGMPAVPVSITTSAGPFTTTSTTAVDLATVSVAAAQGQRVRITFAWSKLATAANGVAYGFKFNSTVVAEAGFGANTAIAESTSTQRAEDGICVIEFVVPPSSLHQNAFIAHQTGYVTATGATLGKKILTPNANDATNGTLTAAIPAAAMTAFSIRAINATNSNTAEAAAIAAEVF